MARITTYKYDTFITGKDKLLGTDSQDSDATKNYLVEDVAAFINTGNAKGSGTTNTLPIWVDGPNGVLGDSQIIQTKVDGGTIFNLKALTTVVSSPASSTPGNGTKLLDLNSGGFQKFSITQDGGGGVALPADGGVTNPGPSFNMGSGVFSNGENGVAMGSTTTAFGNGSLAANFLTLASGGGASAFGLLTEASGLASASFGNKTTASGAYSIASGQDSTALGQSAVAIGEKGDANGKNSFVQGFDCTASGNNSVAMGFESQALSFNSLATGNGNIVRGDAATAFGNNNIVEASGEDCFIGGKSNTVNASQAFVFGLGNSSNSFGSAVFGSQNTITTGSFDSFVAGNANNTNNKNTQILLGKNLIGAANSVGVVLGQYNDNTDTYNKFQMGNGTNAVGGRSNALSINSAGNVKIPTYGSGAVTGTAAYGLSVTSSGQIIETPNVAPAYLSFVCLLSQTGATNPQPDLVLENSLGVATPYSAFTRVSGGEYNLNAPGKFKLLKTIVFLNGGSSENNMMSHGKYLILII